MTILILSNEEMDYVMKINKHVEEYGLLMKGVNQTIKLKQLNKKVDLSACY